MLTPTRSAGSRSGVNWTRFHEQSIDTASDLARLVLPTPGTSSMSRCPSARRHMTAISIGSIFPCTTCPIFAVTASNSAANREPGPSDVGRSLPAWRVGMTVTRRSVDGSGPGGSPGYGRRVASYLAIDVGTDRLAAGVVYGSGEVIVRDRVATPPRDVWPALHRLVRRVVAARPDDADALERCGVSCEIGRASCRAREAMA